MVGNSSIDNWSIETNIKGKNILFRTEKPRDFDKVWEMYNTLGSESIENLPPINNELLQQRIQNPDLSKSFVILAIYENNVVGRSLLIFGEGESSKHRAIFGVVVHDGFQNMGIGSKLTEIMIGFAKDRGLKKVSLEVFPSNLRGIHVYEKYGYVKEGVLRDHYYFRDRYYDVVLMGLSIDKIITKTT